MITASVMKELMEKRDFLFSVNILTTHKYLFVGYAANSKLYC